MKALFIITCHICYLVIAAQNIHTIEWQQLVPSAHLPDSIDIQKSNANLDITYYKGKYYFAFRTAPYHFASTKTKFYILSSTDFEHWDYEHHVFLECDLREPRFVVYRDTLRFYFFQGGTATFKFEPKHLLTTYTIGNGEWQGLQDVDLDGYVLWRLKVRADTLYLSAYYGVDLYKSSHQADLRLFVSIDGERFEPISEAPQVSVSTAEEGEFVFDNDGNLWGTVRLESKGALVIFADKDRLDQWETYYTRYKYDSALLFNHDNDIYLIARRNLDGEMAKNAKWLPKKLRPKYNLLRYSLTAKTTALYKLDKATKKLIPLMDFPSTGDNAFPALVQKTPDSYILLNYSSDFTKGTRNWIRGQLGRTNIYWTELRIE